MSPLLHALAMAVSYAAQAEAHDKERTAALEIGFGTSLQQSNAAPSELSYASFRRNGMAVGASVALRSRYVLIPTLELTRLSLVEGSRASASSGTVATALHAWAYRAGISADVWRLRPSVGIALYDLHTSARVRGTQYTSSELDFGYYASVTAFPYIRGPLRVGVELKGDLLTEAALNSVGVGIRASYDAFSF